MPQEIVINVMSNEVRVALLKNKQLQEVYIERQRQPSIVGNLYKGKIIRLLPSLQAAFVDIGLERAAFLHISDLSQEDNVGIEKNQSIDIQDKLVVGQEVLVQVYKDPLGTKGARLTMQYTLPARYLVLTPNVFEVSVSQKIDNEVERQRLTQTITTGVYGGYIVRTVAEGIASTEFAADQRVLDARWLAIQKQMQTAKIGAVVYQDIPIVLRVLRDLAAYDMQGIQVDNLEIATKMREFAQCNAPDLVARIHYYDQEKPIFDQFSIEQEIQKALQRHVYLPSGSYLVFDQTEAMTTIDINTGSNIRQTNSEQSIFNANLEAVKEIARQIRLRNLGGMIMIDFIDMEEASHKEQLVQALRSAMKQDRVRVEVSDVSPLGLVQMTRKRTRESLENTLCVTCPLCQRRGSIKSLQTMANEIFRQLKRIAIGCHWPGFCIVTSQDVMNYLSDDQSMRWAEVAIKLGKRVIFRAEPNYTQEQYCILPISNEE